MSSRIGLSSKYGKLVIFKTIAVFDPIALNPTQKYGGTLTIFLD